MTHREKTDEDSRQRKVIENQVVEPDGLIVGKNEDDVSEKCWLKDSEGMWERVSPSGEKPQFSQDKSQAGRVTSCDRILKSSPTGSFAGFHDFAMGVENEENPTFHE
jgi:hypothetical protein